MNKPDLIAHIADAANLPKDGVGKAVDAVFAAITAALVCGEDATIKGFGSFTVTDRPARNGHNPKTGEPISIPASKTPKLRAGKSLKDVVNADANAIF